MLNPPCNCGSKPRASVVKHVLCSLIKARIRLYLLAGALTVPFLLLYIMMLSSLELKI
ncbi:hypothetical protein Csa_006838 [Cucumis sativus]|uniref:Uncharacterized protein n=1 Tax=Cucumis sativus TaxID=3659 RepID=A0A0A0LYG4_CUCSA|nr:hypothetical protein Csa_006838 [Cucumis sativus]